MNITTTHAEAVQHGYIAQYLSNYKLYKRNQSLYPNQYDLEMPTCNIGILAESDHEAIERTAEIMKVDKKYFKTLV